MKGVAFVTAWVLALSVPAFAQRRDLPPDVASAVAKIQSGSQSQIEQALFDLDGFIRKWERDPKKAGDVAVAYLYLGVAYLSLDQLVLAQSKFRRVLELDAKVEPASGEFSQQVLDAFQAARGSMRGRHRRTTPYALAGGAAAAGGIGLVLASGGDGPPEGGDVTVDLRLNGQDGGDFSCSSGLFFTISLANATTAAVHVNKFDLNFTQLTQGCMSHAAPVDGGVNRDVGPGPTVEIRRIDLAGSLCTMVGRQPGCRWRAAVLVDTSAGTRGDQLEFGTTP